VEEKDHYEGIPSDDGILNVGARLWVIIVIA